MSDLLDVEQEKSLIRCTYKCFNLKKTIVEMVELNNISSLVVFNIIITAFQQIFLSKNQECNYCC